MTAIFDGLLTIDAVLAQAGVHPLSPFWLGEARRFYEHPSATLLVEMVGRGGIKSITSVKMSIAETLFGGHVVPKGERHFFTHVSENLAEASKTFSILKSYLTMIGEKFTFAGDTIELGDHPLGFKVFAARVGAVSGFRCIGWTLDEAAKLANYGTDAASEIVTSIRGMTVTHRGARGRMFSSPLATVGFFYDAWAAGNNEHQVVGHAPTWVANPSVSEADTHVTEPHLLKWKREFAAEPGSGGEAALDTRDVDAIDRIEDLKHLGTPTMFIDSSAGKGDAFSYGVASFASDGARQYLYIETLGAFTGSFGERVMLDEVVAHIAEIAQKRRIRSVIGDQFMSYALEAAFRKWNLHFIEKAWTQGTKLEAVTGLRLRLRERTLIIDPGPEADLLKTEMKLLEEKILPSGAITFGTRRTAAGHADRAMLVLLMVRAEADGEMRGGTHPNALIGRPQAFAGGWSQGDFMSPVPRGLPLEGMPPPDTAARRPPTFDNPNAPRAIRIRPGRGGWTV
jgi:hypothetical protein